MKTIETPLILQNLADLWELCPDMRFGQLISTLGLLSEDAGGRNLWDVEDEELSKVIEQFRTQLSLRDCGQNGTGADPG